MCVLGEGVVESGCSGYRETGEAVGEWKMEVIRGHMELARVLVGAIKCS